MKWLFFLVICPPTGMDYCEPVWNDQLFETLSVPHRQIGELSGLAHKMPMIAVDNCVRICSC